MEEIGGKQTWAFEVWMDGKKVVIDCSDFKNDREQETRTIWEWDNKTLNEFRMPVGPEAVARTVF